jgi:hypothetical protein
MTISAVEDRMMDRFVGEPSLAELLADPILDMMMHADGCGMAQLTAIMETAATATVYVRQHHDEDVAMPPLSTRGSARLAGPAD